MKLRSAYCWSLALSRNVLNLIFRHLLLHVLQTVNQDKPDIGMNSLIFPMFVAVMWLRIRLFTSASSCNPRDVSHCIYSALNSYVCCELLHRVDLVCCTLSQTAMNCQQLVYQVHVTAFLSTCIQVDSLLNCSSIYCVKFYVLKI